MLGAMRVLLVSTYELGHQPWHLASPAAALEAGGHEVRMLDLSVERLDAGAVDWAQAVAFSVPMHTAMRLAARGVEAVRRAKPDMPVCLYGLYATQGVTGADRVIAGEYEPALVAWADGTAAQKTTIELARARFGKPVRHGLPALDRYAHLHVAGEERTAGYVEASHGCAHLCRHCPVPVVYGGRIRTVDREVVLADVAQQVEAGARHITFGDPDFLNGWRHSLRIVEAMHERFPEVTFDCTTKVEHILRHATLWPRFARAGCLFVVSAFECVNDTILGYLDKGHTTPDAARAVRLLRDHGIEVRPSWLPFMPWTRVSDVADILDFVVDHDLVGNVDAVQYTIRLLVPEGSLLLERPEIHPYLGPYDPDLLTYPWRPADPRTDELQSRLARLVEEAVAEKRSLAETFCDVRDAVWEASGEPARELVLVGVEGRPRLTEPWFC